MPIHFGVNVRESKYGLRLSRDRYAEISKKSSFEIPLSSLDAKGAYEDSERTTYTEAWCEEHRRNCLENFDNNMRFFKSLNRIEFNKAVDTFLNDHSEFKRVDNLRTFSGISGCYLMVLDDYCQIYLGITNNIEKRVRQHWSGTKQFDRLLLPMDAVGTSKFPIDVFRAMDTTRLYAYRTPDAIEWEDEFLSQFPPKFTLNRVQGGVIAKKNGGMTQIGFLEAQSRISEHDVSRSSL